MSTNYVRITPLGGLSGIGKNCTVFETERDIVVIDVGLQFPDEELLGVDWLIYQDLADLESAVAGPKFVGRDFDSSCFNGDYVTGKRIITEETKKEMNKVLAEIQDGTFARNWILENQANRPHFNAVRAREKNHLIEKTGAELRAMMSWQKADKYEK